MAHEITSNVCHGLPSLHISELDTEIDIGILTVREDEFEAVLQRLDPTTHLLGGKNLYEFRKLTDMAGEEVAVAVTRILEPGQGLAESIAGNMIEDLNPKWLFLVGIGGGMPSGDYTLGDVILATRYHDFAVSAVMEEANVEYSDAGGPAHVKAERVLAVVKAYRAELSGWNRKDSIRLKQPKLLVPDGKSDQSIYGSDAWKDKVLASLSKHFRNGVRPRPPIFKAESVASSNSLIKSAEVAETWLRTARDVRAVEMELAGVYRAARHRGQRDYPIIAIRGLSDIIGYIRNDDWTSYACQTAAAFACALIRSTAVVERSGPKKVKQKAMTAGTADHTDQVEFFRPIKLAITELGRNLTFPSIEDFEQGYVHNRTDIIEPLTAWATADTKGPALLTGRSGAGKTVVAASLGMALQNVKNCEAYYCDLADFIGKGDDADLSSQLLRSHPSSVSHSKSPVYIVDNAHLFPRTSYVVAERAARDAVRVLLVSRPISDEMCDQKQYYPELFARTSPQNLLATGATDEPTEIEPTAKSTISHPHLMLWPSLETAHGIVGLHLKRFSMGENDISFQLEDLYKNTRDDLSLLALCLKNWNPRVSSCATPDFTRVYEVLSSRYLLDRFPELYTIAALACFDCPTDRHALFHTPERATEFDSVFFLPGRKEYGLLRRWSSLYSGISAGEGRLICQTAVHKKAICDDNGELAESTERVQQILLSRYAACWPHNPYQLLRCMRWAVFEATSYGGSREEESILEILVSILSRDEFAAYIREVIVPKRLSMIGLTNIARLCKYVGLSPVEYSKLLTRKAIENGIRNYRTHHYPSRRPAFLTPEYDSWRHLHNLDPEYGELFVRQFKPDQLIAWGTYSLRTLGCLLFLAANMQCMKEPVEESLEHLFGRPERFLERFSSASEVSAKFFVRDVSLFGRSAVDLFQSLLPPKKLAVIVKVWEPSDVGFLNVLPQCVDGWYLQEFADEFETDEMYRLVYGKHLAKINFSHSYELFERFVKTDLRAQIKNASLHDIQLFLRNVLWHGFGTQHRRLVSKVFEEETIRKSVQSKLDNQDGSLKDIAFLLMNLADLYDEQLAVSYAENSRTLKCSILIPDASLCDVAMFLFAFWMLGLSPFHVLNEGDFEQLVKSRFAHASLEDLFTTAGIGLAFDINLEMPTPITRMDARLRRYFMDLEEARIADIGFQQHHLMSLSAFALRFLGARVLGVNRTDLRELIDTTAVERSFESAIASIRKRFETTMTMAFGSLPTRAQRKVVVLEKAYEWLSQGKSGASFPRLTLPHVHGQ